jgi:hypothetical protein
MDLRRTIGARQVRLTGSIDEESRRFESDLIRILASEIEGDGVRELPWIQTHAYLESCPREFRLLQTRDAAGAPSAQIAVYLSRPRRAPWFATGLAERFGPAADGEEEEFALRTLRDLFLELGEVMALRLRPERFESVELWNFQERAQRAGYRLADAGDATRTLIYDLRPSEEELLSGFSRKDRTKFRNKELELVEIKPLTDRRFIPQCREALNAAFARTSGEKVHFDFETTFSLISKYPDRAAVLGFFLKKNPERLLAYSTGFRSGAMAEFSSAGSLKDSELRVFPFNYLLLWNLILWAKRSGASFLDLRGVTGGGISDPLDGISYFKRRFGGREIEINREMTAVLKPKLHAIFPALNRLGGRRK